MTKKEIEHLANLSKLDFGERELEVFAKEFKNILDFVSVVENAKINTKPQVARIALNDLRADEIRESLSQAKVLMNAPGTDGEYFIVPKVVE